MSRNNVLVHHRQSASYEPEPMGIYKFMVRHRSIVPSNVVTTELHKTYLIPVEHHVLANGLHMAVPQHPQREDRLWFPENFWKVYNDLSGMEVEPKGEPKVRLLKLEYIPNGSEKPCLVSRYAYWTKKGDVELSLTSSPDCSPTSSLFDEIHDIRWESTEAWLSMQLLPTSQEDPRFNFVLRYKTEEDEHGRCVIAGYVADNPIEPYKFSLIIYKRGAVWERDARYIARGNLPPSITKSQLEQLVNEFIFGMTTDSLMSPQDYLSF